MPEVEFQRPPSGAANAQAVQLNAAPSDAATPPSQTHRKGSRHLQQPLQLRHVLQPGADGLACRLAQVVVMQAARAASHAPHTVRVYAHIHVGV